MEEFIYNRIKKIKNMNSYEKILLEENKDIFVKIYLLGFLDNEKESL